MTMQQQPQQQQQAPAAEAGPKDQLAYRSDFKGPKLSPHAVRSAGSTPPCSGTDDC